MTDDDHRTRPRRRRGEGTYWTRPNGVEVFTMKLDGGGTRSVSAPTHKELLKKVEKLKSEVARGVGAGGATKLSVWGRYWLDEICTTRVKPTTLQSHRSKMEQHIIPALGQRRLRDIKPEHVRAFYADLAEREYSTATIRQVHVILSRCLKVATMEGKIERNPCDNVEPPKTTGPPEIRRLSVAECATVLAWLRRNREPKEVARWSVALLGGLRQGEVLGLDWEHVDWAARAIHVRQAQAYVGGEYILQTPKTARSVRSVPMMNGLYADLHAYWVKAGSPRNGLVFGPANTGVDSRKWKNHQRLARIAEPVSVHSCRKTTGSMLSDAGVPSRIIADILGQENPEVTDAHYIRTELDIRRKGIDKVGKLLTKATKQIEKKDAS